MRTFSFTPAATGLFALTTSACIVVQETAPVAHPECFFPVDGSTMPADAAADGATRPADAGAATDAGTTNPPADTGTTTTTNVPTGTILYVTQVPNGSFTSVARAFSNHVANVASAPRGGALMLRYPDGTLRNLTREAGFGTDGMQGASSIAVREPSVHWDGQRALFSMVVGAATRRYEVRSYYWQIYEVTGLGMGQQAVIRRIPNQPSNFNNVSPIYASDDRVIFTSDRPRNGETHHYPLLDEYESAATITGLWSLDVGTGDLRMLENSPSGSFSPSVDSFGRVIFTKWDHLQRDQQADAQRFNGASYYGAFTYADEGATASRITDLAGTEVFPEPRVLQDPDRRPNESRHTFNQFYPWQILQDGTEEETLNHVGRQEFGGTYTDRSFTDDPNLTYLTPESFHANRFYLRGDGGLFQLREDPRNAGTFFATYAPEFSTDAAGMLLRVDGAPSANPDQMRLYPVTHPDTYSTQTDPAAIPNSTGHYRNALPMSDGTLVAVHSPTLGTDTNLGTSTAPRWSYAFRLKSMRAAGSYYVADQALTPGTPVTVSWWSPDELVTWTGVLWELDPVEVRARPRPPVPRASVASPEMSVFNEEGVDLERLRTWMRTNDLALIVSRNVTQRDRSDVQQPYNLRVPGGVQSIAHSGRVYDVPFFQMFQGDALRGYGGATNPRAGRRLLARPIHAPVLPNVTASGAPSGSVQVAADGSVAAFVPARRAITWQLTDSTGGGVVRERNWVSFQPGEIRTCPSCHGVNTASQTMATTPTNPPEALRTLVRAWLASGN